MAVVNVYAMYTGRELSHWNGSESWTADSGTRKVEVKVQLEMVKTPSTEFPGLQERRAVRTGTIIHTLHTH